MIYLSALIVHWAAGHIYCIRGKGIIWGKKHEKTFHILWYIVIGNVYNKIKHNTNSIVKEDLLVTIFKPLRASPLNNILKRLHDLTFNIYDNLSDNITKIWVLVNELCKSLSEFRVNKICYIYKFQSNPGPDQANYFERYTKDHDLFDVQSKAKYFFSSAMQHFKNTAKNNSSKNCSLLNTRFIAVQFSRSYTSYPASCTNTNYQLTSDFHKINWWNTKLIKVKYCNFC